MGRRLRASDPARARRPKPAPVETRTLAHPKVWATAIKVAEGNATLITVRSFREVEVRLP